jgi:hypothetical protein
MKLNGLQMTKIPVLPDIGHHIVLRLNTQIDPFAKEFNGYFIHHCIVQDVIHDIKCDQDDQVITVVVAFTWEF